MITVIHGGQTGVDRGAHEAAMASGWHVDGYMPANARDEQGRIPEDVAQHLRPHASTSYAARTAANVRASAALLAVARDASDALATPGTAQTIALAEGRQLLRLIVDPSWDVAIVARWIQHDLLAPCAQLSLDGPQALRSLRLMIAGPRESRWPGARVATADFLRRVAVLLEGVPANRKSA